jgi:hypothetical protein
LSAPCICAKTVAPKISAPMPSSVDRRPASPNRERLHGLLVLHELYPSKEALDAAGTGAADAMHETFGQLDELLASPGATAG